MEMKSETLISSSIEAFVASCCLKYFVRKERIVSNDVHLECTAKLTYTLTDTAKAHDTKESCLSARGLRNLYLFPLVFYFYIVVC